MKAALTIVALSVLISLCLQSCSRKADSEKANQVAAVAASAPTMAATDISQLESLNNSVAVPMWNEPGGDTTGKPRRWPHDPGCPCGPGPFLTPVPLEQH